MSTPPLSRNNSSSHLDSSNQLSEQIFSKQNEKRETGESIDTESNQSKKGSGKTGKTEQRGTDLKERPKLRSKRSQPNLFIGVDGLPSSPLHTPPMAREVRSTPTKLSTSATLPPISLSDVQTTLKSSDSSSGSTAVIQSPREKGVAKEKVCGNDLTQMVCQIIDIGCQKDYILSPEKLAHLMVAVENQCGKQRVSAHTVKSILREPLIILNYETASGVKYKSINIMEMFCEPFIKHHLDQKKLDELLQKVMREYARVGVRVTKLSEGLRPVEQINHPDIVALMVPVMKLVGNYFFGSDMKMASSKFPDPIKKLLLEIDRLVIAWFENTTDGEMVDLLQLRKSALVGFISTFSFMTIWAPKLAADTKKSPGFYAKLSSYINSYLVNKLDPFVIDILLNQEHQSEKIKNHIVGYAKELKLKAQSASKIKLEGVEKGGMLSSIKGLFSPRSSSTSHLSGTSRETTDEGNEINEESVRQSEMQRKRIVRLTEFAKIAGFDKISTEFFILIRNKIIDLKAKDYNAFTKDPVAYCHQQLDAFKMQKDEKNTDSELFKKIEQSINSYGENLEKKNEEEKSQLNSPLLTPDVSPIKKSEGAEKIDATESYSSAVEQKVSADVKSESKPVSEKTESDSSTLVETEKSDD
jgi:hypothetical protein